MSILLRHGPVMSSLSERPVPYWVTDGWFSNNPGAQSGAIKRWANPVTTAADREIGLRFVAPGESFCCTSCGQHRFPAPTVCFWCRNKSDNVNKNMTVEQNLRVSP